METWFVLTIFLATALCGSIEKNFDVGNETTIDKIPYQAALVDRKNEFLCGAVIISKKHLLTTADLWLPEWILARVASDRFDKGGQIIAVKEVIKHPKFSPTTNEYNFAVIVLANEIILGPKAQIISLVVQDKPDPEEETPISVSGWYPIWEHRLTNSLRIMNIALKNWKLCDDVYPINNYFHACLAKTDNEKPMHCVVDFRFRGNPCVHNESLYGIGFHFGYCEVSDFYGICERVSVATDWIVETIVENQ